MIHPDTELRYINETIGYGVFATKPIPKGTFVWVLDELDEIIDLETVNNLPEILKKNVETYSYRDVVGNYILCWDFGRYLNHSCHPPILSLGHSVEVAIRDIAVGEEISCDYGILNYTGSFNCSCKHPDCRQTIQMIDIDQLSESWDLQVQDVLQLIPKVAQPLRDMIKTRPNDQAMLTSIFNGEAVTIPSHSVFKLDPNINISSNSSNGSDFWQIPDEQQS